MDVDELASPAGRASRRAAWEKAYSTGHPAWRGPADVDGSKIRGVVLELGCGDGKSLSGILGSDADMVVGLDHSKRALEACERRFAGDQKVGLVLGDAMALPFKDLSFDTILAFHTLEHFLQEERKAVAGEMRRIMMPSGRILVRAFSVEDLRFGKGKRLEEGTYLRGNGMIMHYFADAELEDLFWPLVPLEMKKAEKRVNSRSGMSSRALVEATFGSGRR